MDFRIPIAVLAVLVIAMSAVCIADASDAATEDGADSDASGGTVTYISHSHFGHEAHSNTEQATDDRYTILDEDFNVERTDNGDGTYSYTTLELNGIFVVSGHVKISNQYKGQTPTITGESIDLIILDGSTLEVDGMIYSQWNLEIYPGVMGDGTPVGTGKVIANNVVAEHTLNLHGVDVEARADHNMTRMELDYGMPFPAIGLVQEDKKEDHGSYVIYDGNIVAEGFHGSGLGVGRYCGYAGVGIHILDGTVKATSVYGAGIGTGSYLPYTSVQIYGGDITAYSKYGSGIGTGPDRGNTQEYPGYGFYVYLDMINGAVVRASTGNPEAAGIGFGPGVRERNPDMDFELHIWGGTTYASSLNISAGFTDADYPHYDFDGKLFYAGKRCDDIDLQGGRLWYDDDVLAAAQYVLADVRENLQMYEDAYMDGYLYVVDHNHSYYEDDVYAPDGSYHQKFCTYDVTGECGYMTSSRPHEFGYDRYSATQHTATCQICSHSLLEGHDRDVLMSGDSDPDNHAYMCSKCGETFKEPHRFDGRLEGDTHYMRCRDCGFTKTAEHMVLFTTISQSQHAWRCPNCESGGTAEHSLTWTDNGDGTHTGSCICRWIGGGLFSVTEGHTYVDGVCSKCGAIHPGLIGGGMDDILPPAWGYDENAQSPTAKQDEEWIAIAVAATAATIMAVFLIWDRRKS